MPVRIGIICLMVLANAAGASAQTLRLWFSVSENEGGPGGKVVIDVMTTSDIPEPQNAVRAATVDLIYDPAELDFVGAGPTDMSIDYYGYGAYQTLYPDMVRLVVYSLLDAEPLKIVGLHVGSTPVKFGSFEFAVGENGLLPDGPTFEYVTQSADFVFVDDLYCMAIRFPCDIVFGPPTQFSSLLPVEMTSFEADSRHGVVALSWETQSETNNAGFTVEHSLSGEEWTEIGFIEGAGTSAYRRQYAFETEELEPGFHWFRLKQTDFDGTASYSQKVSAAVEFIDTYFLGKTFPNPAMEVARVRVSVARTQDIRAILYNQLGQAVREVLSTPMQRDRVFEVTVSRNGLPAGAYYLRVRGETFDESRQLVFVK